MAKPIMISLLFISLFPLAIKANIESTMQAAFVRDGNLWTLIDSEQEQITNEGTVLGTPKWSYDGSLVVYQRKTKADNTVSSSELWVYEVKSGKEKRISYDGENPKWAPNKNILSFTSNGILNISDLNRFYNVAMGVDTYTWLPDASGFLVSAQANLLPDGWTNPKLYRKKLSRPIDQISLTGNINHFFDIPKKLGTEGRNVMAINVSDMTYSPSGAWISFLVSPTASMAMDSNMLAVISNNGESFQVLDELILEVGKPKWAPSKEILAYIAGGGRLVAGFKDKDLKLKELPVSSDLTPENYAELDFTWIDNNSIVTSRVVEQEWSNRITEQPHPKLFAVELQQNRQTNIIEAPNGLGDYQPQFIPSLEKIVWLRGKSLTDTDKNLWIARPDGKDVKRLLTDVETYTFY